MTTYLMIAGHGKQKNGKYDSGATGYISKGEHWYMENILFPTMKKYIPNGHTISWITSYNVYSYGDLVNLAKKYGNDTIVSEFHYDAASATSAKGGHVIIHKEFSPDDIDKKLVKALGDTIGLNTGYVHRGIKGLSGRDDLANVNRARMGGINYRLLEIGFGTNYHDSQYMMNNVDDLAKALVKAYFGKIKDSTPQNDLYRVQVGAFKDKNNAQKQLEELKKKGYNDAFIV